MQRAIDGIVNVGVLCVGWACLGLSFLIGFEILARKFLGFSVQGADEIGGYVLAMTGAMGFSYALVRKAHMRIDIFLGRTPHFTRAPLNLLAMLSLAGFSAFMAWQASRALMESIDFGSRAFTSLRTPMWLPQSIWFTGLAIFAGVTLVYAIHALVLIIRAPRQLNEIYGPLSLDEEIAGEVSDLTPPGADAQDTAV